MATESAGSDVEILDDLDPSTASAARDLVARVARIDGVDGLSEQARAAIDSGGVTHLVRRSPDDGSLAGYANITPGRDDEPPMIEAAVDPDHRRRGHGLALVRSAFDTAPDPARIWAHGDLPGAKALAATLDLIALRELLSLRRPLGDPDNPLPPLDIPDDLVLRTYEGSGDDAEILRVNNAAFDWHPEQGGWGKDEITARTGSDWFDPEGLFLVFDRTDPKTLLGFHWTKVHPAVTNPDGDDEPALGEVYIVGVDTGTQGRGLGRILTLAGIRYLEDTGLGEVELYVEGDNAAALHTYARLGFTQHSIDVAYG
ncbi:mycothiol synthase [Williamsia phyllosphaerae]|uniref:Mycothiol acetyltransferase n=1 Tax=Williamsia phyllosphaerae TaxID=885042 RepID=A0ABQ1V6A0_9NOCA|nr:mycothiol synthase [Williamsia phyllosphaerae]GGF37834.1 mycothiol acetyltransferase [Williamsia phyllosphaerae]